MQTTLLAVLFLSLFAIVLIVVSLGLRFLESERKKRVKDVLSAASGEAPALSESNLLTAADERGPLAGIPVLGDLPAVKGLKQTLQQAGLSWSAGGVLTAMLIGAVAGALLGLRIRIPVYREFAVVALACALGSLPYLYVRFRRRKRLAEFEGQFPESLDFLARSMRAGHAFSVSLEMLSDEFPEPLGMEFRQVFNEQNLGAPIETAMRNLADRVPLLDVRFFVSAVLLQRETGGNLAEILTKLAYVIRERFRLKGQVRAVSAHGRITAVILSAMPLITMLLLMIIAPQYLSSMATDKHGRFMIIGAILGQFAGYMWMRKIIRIKV